MTPTVSRCSTCARNTLAQPCYQWQRTGSQSYMLNCERYVRKAE